ncbi:hypothetical protein B0T19DRAFT_443822 [Cercophora scortea]|uniref:Protein HRI1 n=1 Tax=Cercophora scortea TaxID=314031 RepID=A0AAE0M9K6_9PEZI|nr:hypothetical protein B0T19DRAFT_443822 [Cercophora scortea]
MGDISHREYIRWLPEGSSEPTSTIVLTSPERRFVDLRILRAPSSSPYYASDSSSDVFGDDLPLSRLDWAIAGTSTSTVRDSEDGTGRRVQVRHSRWHHWIDSRTRNAEEASDQGDMYTQDDTRTLERGRMVNPATGLETEYEEMWRSEPAHDTPASLAVCVVLEFHDDAAGKRGMVVRLGQYCQGFLREGDQLTAERLKCIRGGERERDAAEGRGGSAWIIQAKIGYSEMPTDFATDFGHEAEVGDEVKVGGNFWRVVEKSGV